MSFIEYGEPIDIPSKKHQLLSLEKITKNNCDRSSVHNLCLSIGDGEIVALVGDESSGKDTTLDLICGHLLPNSGRIIFAGEDVTSLPHNLRHQRGIAQSAKPGDLFLDLKPAENILLCCGEGRRPIFPRQGGSSLDEEAHELLRFTGLAAVAHLSVAQLSPVRQRMLAIAIAIAGKPSLLLLDTPPDATYKDCAETAGLLWRIAASGISILIAGRHLCPLIQLCDRAALLSKGKILAVGLPSQIMKWRGAICPFFQCDSNGGWDYPATTASCLASSSKAAAIRARV